MFWKSLAGRCIYRSDNIRVFDNYFYRWLKFNSDSFQSLLSKYNPEKPALNYVKALTFTARQLPGSCCMLGLGGGGVAHALSPFLGTHRLTAVEMNPEVIDVANRYFMIDKIKNLVIIHDEANHFIKQCKQKFKHLLVDIADNRDFPASCKNESFFQNCQQVLEPSGILAINIANRHEHEFIFSHLKKQFNSHIITIPVKGCANIIFVATYKDNFNLLMNCFNKNNQVKHLVWDQKWGYMADIW